MEGKNKVAQILMKRDGVTEEEANYMIDACVEEMAEEGFEPSISEEILMQHLGLEPDYLFDLLKY